jgi:hypothetical protein
LAGENNGFISEENAASGYRKHMGKSYRGHACELSGKQDHIQESAKAFVAAAA